MKIIADDKIPFLKGVLEPFADITYLPGRLIGKEQVKDANAVLIRTRTKCTESLFKESKVSFIGTATIGFDHIDTRYCESHNIKWTNAPGCNSSSVQQYIAAALLKMAGDFQFRLSDKTIGIIGVGNVGSKIEKLAKVMGMKVLLNDPPRARKEGVKNFVDLDTLLKESDIITLHVPLNIVGEDKTYRLIDDKTIYMMKKGAWLINTSRGEVAESIVLKKALSAARIGGVVLDVWENEPDIDYELLEKAFLATPHIAGYSADGKANGTAMIINALSKIFNLPLRNWYPEIIPEPHIAEITINAKNRDTEDIIRQAVFHTYSIVEDDLKLRFSPSDFEKQRGEYPVRREFPSFSIHLAGGTKKVQKMLEELGFRIVV
ncbi:MAG: 4-phosphoerythronate dehydrogenase PdxB [Odoribacter sp.]|nr:4-phosphoerythronate dehydrogenase PdxB [Odoribacter sp.]